MSFPDKKIQPFLALLHHFVASLVYCLPYFEQSILIFKSQMISIRVLVALVLLAVFGVTNAMPKPTRRSLTGRLNGAVAAASAQRTVSANNTRCELPSSPATPSTTASPRKTPRTQEQQERNTLLTHIKRLDNRGEQYSTPVAAPPGRGNFELSSTGGLLMHLILI